MTNEVWEIVKLASNNLESQKKNEKKKTYSSKKIEFRC